MKYGVEFNLGGGLFSYYLIILANLDKWLENGKISIDDKLFFDSRYDTGNNLKTLPPERSGMSSSSYNIFDYLFEQNQSDVDNTIITEYPHMECNINNLNTIKERYKYISKHLIKINQNVLDKVTVFMDDNFKENMLGVHIRMTDMNLHAAGHKSVVITENDYFGKIDEVLIKENIDKIFVASDNMEMIDKLSSRYDICYYDMVHRQQTQNTSKAYWLQNWVPNGKPNDWGPDYYIESMIDSILLSYCNVLIARKSALNYSSNTYEWSKIKEYYSLEG